MPLKRPAPGPYIESDQKRRCETIMNKTIQELTDRKSVRAFTEQPIDQETKKVIIQAAMEAPTAGNQQLYTILDITDQKLKERLAETCDHQPFIARAQMVLILDRKSVV